jgi:hypothetical protein
LIVVELTGVALTVVAHHRVYRSIVGSSVGRGVCPAHNNLQSR